MPGDGTETLTETSPKERRMPQLQARVGGALVSQSNRLTFTQSQPSVSVALRFDEPYRNAQPIPITVPPQFQARIGGQVVTSIPAQFLSNADAFVEFVQTQGLPHGTNPSLSATIGTTQILLEAVEGDPVPNTPPYFTSGPSHSNVTHNSATITAAFADAEGDPITATYRVNGGSWLAFSSPQALSGLAADTAYTVEVRLQTPQHTVIESVGFITATTTAAADTTAPVLSGTLTATEGDGQVTLTGPSATDNVGIDKWQYRIGAGAWVDIASTSGTMPSTVVSGLTNGTQYSFEVRAVDAAGNPSNVSNTATATPQAVPQSQAYYLSAAGQETPLLGTLVTTSPNAVSAYHFGVPIRVRVGTGAWSSNITSLSETTETTRVLTAAGGETSVTFDFQNGQGHHVISFPAGVTLQAGQTVTFRLWGEIYGSDVYIMTGVAPGSPDAASRIEVS